MEETRNQRTVASQEFTFLKLLSHSSFVAFFFIFVFLELGSSVRNQFFLGTAGVALVFYIFSQRSRSLSLASLGWIMLAVTFILSFVSSGKANDLTITVSILFLLASYELSRFGYLLDSARERSRALGDESLERLSQVMRNHSRVLAEILFLSLLSSLVLEYFALGVVIINPPAVGVSVFAVLAVLLIALVTLRRE